MDPFWQRTKDTVAEILDYANKRGVRIGVENREKLDELPLDEDLVEYFAMLPLDAPIGYWHDTGHAEIKQSMGLIDHRLQVEQLAARTIGFHLHDVNSAGQDHQPVGSGTVDFKGLRPFWKPKQPLVIELSPRVPVDGVRSSLRKVEALVG